MSGGGFSPLTNSLVLTSCGTVLLCPSPRSLNSIWMRNLPAGVVDSCDQGAYASDAEDGILTYQILSCPPRSCMLQGLQCEGHEFLAKVKRGLEAQSNPNLSWILAKLD